MANIIGKGSSTLTFQHNRSLKLGVVVEWVDTNQMKGLLQVAAGENPLFRVTDISKGREVTPEWEVKRGVGTRPPSSSKVQILGYPNTKSSLARSGE